MESETPRKILEDEVSLRLRRYCEDNGITGSQFINNAVKLELNRLSDDKENRFDIPEDFIFQKFTEWADKVLPLDKKISLKTVFSRFRGDIMGLKGIVSYNKIIATLKAYSEKKGYVILSGPTQTWIILCQKDKQYIFSEKLSGGQANYDQTILDWISGNVKIGEKIYKTELFNRFLKDHPAATWLTHKAFAGHILFWAENREVKIRNGKDSAGRFVLLYEL